MDKYREQRRTSCRDVGKLGFPEPSMKGYVSMAKPKEQFDGMDMKVHLILKPTEKSKSRHRSQSLSHTEYGKIQNNVLFCENNRTNSRRDKDKKNLAIESKNNGKCWNDILGNHEVPPPRKNNQACNRRSHSASPEPEHIDDETVGRRRTSKHLSHEENPKDINQANMDVNAFSALLNPVRSIHFLINELRSVSQPLDGRQQGIFKLLEQVLLKLPENSPQGCGAKCSAKHEASNPVTRKHSNQYSRTGYETMRKERDSLQKQLNDKTKSHIVLERKVATLEAKLLHVKSERDELQGVNEKLIAGQKSLLATLNSRGNENPDSQSKNQLIEELNSAHEYISKLQAGMVILEKQYNSKMKEVQGILHDGFDSSKNESFNLENILGRPPEEEPSLIDPVQFSLPNFVLGPEVRPDSPVPPPIASPAPAPTKELGKINIDQYINNLLQQSGLLKEEQVSIFQSFASIPDYQAPTTENS